jgi:hypothetical protein
VVDPNARFLDETGLEPATFVLRRADDKGNFLLERPFSYRDPLPPPQAGPWRTFRVPAPQHLGDFTTDFASIPFFASWLVPRDGTHTPAAILHDALGQRKTDPPLTDDVEVDRIFRDAMAHLGVALLRRWMMWAAVMLRTLCKRVPQPARATWWLRVGLALGVLVPYGVLASLDLIDAGAIAAPWMGEGTGWFELRRGAVVALGALVATPLLFFEHWRVGMVIALAVIPLAFPMALATAAYGAYFVLETILAKVLKLRWDPVIGRSPPGEPWLVRQHSD